MQTNHFDITDYLRNLKKLEDAVWLKSNTLWIIYQDLSYDTDSMTDFKTGAIQYGIYLRDYIPFLMLKFGNLNFDFVINAFDLIPQVQRRQLRQYAGDACFMMLEHTKQTILVERKFQLNPHFVAHFKSSIELQWKYYHSEAGVLKKIGELSEFLCTEEMMDETKLYESSAIADEVK